MLKTILKTLAFPLVLILAMLAVTVIAGLIGRHAYEEVYAEAEAYLENGDYISAWDVFETIDGFKDVSERMAAIYDKAQYERGVRAVADKRYLDAIEALIPIAKNKDVDELLRYSMKKYLEGSP